MARGGGSGSHVANLARVEGLVQGGNERWVAAFGGTGEGPGPYKCVFPVDEIVVLAFCKPLWWGLCGDGGEEECLGRC